jgi:DNA-binding CsgD family transcriptional regulator
MSGARTRLRAGPGSEGLGRGDERGTVPVGKSSWFDRFRGAYLDGLCLSFFGIGILRFWYQYNLYNLHATTDYGVGVAWTNVLRAAVGGLLVLCALRGELPARARRALVWASLALMTLSSSFNLLEVVVGQGHDPSSAFEIARYVTCGVGLVWGGGMWMDVYARLSPSRAFLCVVGGLALSCLLSLVAGYLSPYAMGVVNLFVPAFSVLAYWDATHRLDAAGRCAPPRHGLDRRYGGQRRGDVVQLGASFFMFAFVLGITLGYPDGDPRELGQLVRTVHQAVLVAVLVGLLLWVFKRGGAFRFTGVWYFENVLLIVAIVLLTSDAGWTRSLATALFLSAESFFYSFVFFTSYALGRHMSRPPMFVLGVLYSGSLAAMGLGRLFSTLIPVLPYGEVVMFVAMSTLMVVEMVMALRLGIFRGDEALFGEIADEVASSGVPECAPAPAAAGEPPVGADGAREALADRDIRAAAPGELAHLESDIYRVRVDELREAHGLTDVECEIAVRIARARSRSVIAAELGYSQNTIRNYTRSLYAKLGIHSKQQLVDLMEGRTGAEDGLA